MAVLASQQRHILTFVNANSSYNAAEFWAGIGDDFVNLLNGMTFAGDIFLPIPLRAMRKNAVAVRWAQTQRAQRCFAVQIQYRQQTDLSVSRSMGRGRRRGMRTVIRTSANGEGSAQFRSARQAK